MRTSNLDTEAFVKVVEQALEHFHDTAWLSSKSPLSAPYYLGKLLEGRSDADTSAGRFQVLQQSLRKASEQLHDEHRHLLNVAYFERDARLNNIGVMLRLNETKPTYYRRRKEAIYALAIAFNKSIQPPLRPEQPMSRRMIGRADIKVECLNSLRTSKSVAIIGPTGIGKTTFGIALAEAWGRPRCFWFTFRPGLNDDLSSLLFALGYFLHGLGSSHLWRQLVADGGAVELKRILGLLRYDFAQLQSNPPLLCMDEVELLKSGQERHVAVIELLRELLDVAPLLMIGQQLVVEAQHPVTFLGLSNHDMYDLLDSLGMGELDLVNKQSVLALAQGNPALASIIALLYRTGEPIESALAMLSQAPSLLLLLERLWKRLSQEERQLMLLLALFRSPAPLDALRQPRSPWESALSQLLDREIVIADRAGSVTLVNHMRDFVLGQIPAEIRVSLHQQAATIHATRADYTEAAYHLIEAGEPERAIALWLSHQEEETERGRAPQARTIFESIDENKLSNAADRRALALLRGRQMLITGATESAIAVLSTAHWPISHNAHAYVEMLRGDAYRNLSQFDKAEERYRAALASSIGSHELRRVLVHGKLGYLFATHVRDLPRARREGLEMQLATLSFRGYVAEESGDFTLAQDFYEQALDTVVQLGNRVGDQSRIYSDLGRLTWRQGHAKVSIDYLEKAIASDQTLGEPVSALVDHLNLSAAYIIAGEHEKSLAQVLTSLPLAEALNNPYLAAGLASNGAEACLYLNRLDEAEHYAVQSLRHEEASHRPYALTVLGCVRQKQARFQDAADILQAAIESARTNSDIYAEAPAWSYLGEAFDKLNKFLDAKDAFSKAKTLFQQLGLESERAHAEKMLARV